jgi:beta-lactamase regulating signal transducer with metallopeptidase domain
MWVGLDWFGQILVDATLATTILLSLVILLMLLCLQPARRIVLAQAATVLTLLMIPLIASNPLPRLEALMWFAGHDPGTSRTRANAPIGGDSSGRSVSRPAGLGQPTAGASGQGIWWTGPWPLRVFTLIYLTGVSVGVFWLVLGFWGIRRLVGKSVEPSPATRALYDALIQHVDGRSPAPGLRISARINRPVLVGLFRSFILIPPAYDDQGFDRESLKIILLHELAHADQGDTHFGAAVSLAQSLWFFLPYLWWLRAQLRTDQEFLADQRVALLAGSPAGYATRLVALATPHEGSPTVGPILESASLRSSRSSNGGFPSPLLQRILMLLHCPYPLEPQPPRWWVFSAPLLILTLAILSACASVSLLDHQRAVPAAASFATGAPNTFRIAQFIASPRHSGSSGRSASYALPLPLPTQFELNVEIQASRSALSHIRLVGLALDSPPPSGELGDAPSVLTDALTSWHRVRVRRQAGRVALAVDGKAIPVDRDPENLPEWLTIEPAPDQTAILRNLLVTW